MNPLKTKEYEVLEFEGKLIAKANELSKEFSKLSKEAQEMLKEKYSRLLMIELVCGRIKF